VVSLLSYSDANIGCQASLCETFVWAQANVFAPANNAGSRAGQIAALVELGLAQRARRARFQLVLNYYDAGVSEDFDRAPRSWDFARPWQLTTQLVGAATAVLVVCLVWTANA